MPIGAFKLNSIGRYLAAASSNRTTITPTGFTVSTAQSKFGGASAFSNGTSTYKLNVAGLAGNEITTQFTWETWVYFTSVSADTYADLYMNSTYTDQNRIYAVFSGAEANRLYIAIGRSGAISFLFFPQTWAINTWYHVAITRDSANDIRAFVNGTQIGTTQNNSRAWGSQAANDGFDIGRWRNDTGRLRGYVDEYRISKTARYITNFTAPTAAFTNDSNTLFLMHADGANGSTTFTDDNVTPSTIYPTNSVKFGTTSTSGYYADTAISEFVTSSNPGVTFACWVKPTKANHSGSEWWAFALTNTDGGNYSFLLSIKDNGDLRIYRQLAPGFQDFNPIVTGAFPTADQWYHVAVALNSTTQVMQVYINGVAKTTSGTLSTTSSRWDILNGIYVGGTGGTRDGRADIMTQIWADNSFVDLSTNISKFYDNGYVNMGSSGTNSGLSQPLFFHDGSTTSSPAFSTKGGRTSGQYITYNLLDNDTGTLANG